MIHALQYEPQGQRQRFEPQEQQSGDVWHKHIHLHLHLHLSFRGRQGRFSHLSATRMLIIFTTLFVATVMAFAFAFVVDENRVPTPLLYTYAGYIINASLLLAWGALVLGGIPLLFSGWHSKLRVRFGLSVALIMLILTLFQQVLTVPLLVLLSFLGFCRVFDKGEVAGTWLRFASRLSFVTVGAMVLLLLGGLLWCLSLVLVAPGSLQMSFLWYKLLPFFLGMCIAVIVAISTLFWQPRSRDSAQARPKDASPSDFDSSQEPRGYRG